MDTVASVDPAAGPAREDRRGAAGAAPLSLRRLYVLRAGYLVVGGGLVVYRWPSFLRHDQAWPLMDGIVISMLVAMSVLMLLGLRYPLKMLPILLFEAAWKLLWLGTVALPLQLSGQMDPATWEKAVECSWVVVVLVTVPWRYAFSQYVTAHGDPWRGARRSPSSPAAP